MKSACTEERKCLYVKGELCDYYEPCGCSICDEISTEGLPRKCIHYGSDKGGDVEVYETEIYCKNKYAWQSKARKDIN